VLISIYQLVLKIFNTQQGENIIPIPTPNEPIFCEIPAYRQGQITKATCQRSKEITGGQAPRV
jgi:hypothetical protein